MNAWWPTVGAFISVAVLAGMLILRLFGGIQSNRTSWASSIPSMSPKAGPPPLNERPGMGASHGAPEVSAPRRSAAPLSEGPAKLFRPGTCGSIVAAGSHPPSGRDAPSDTSAPGCDEASLVGRDT